MKKNKLCILILILSMAIFVCSCGKKDSLSDNTNNETTVINTDYPKYDNASDIVDASNLIVSGTVTDIKYEILDVSSKTKDNTFGPEETQSLNLPYTIFEIKVDKVYKGNLEGDTVLLKRLGGIKDNTNYDVSDAQEINKEQKYLFMAVSFEDSYPSLVNTTQAAYDMNVAESNSEYNLGDNATKSEDGSNITLAQILELLE